jgi:hypothetical protein
MNNQNRTVLIVGCVVAACLLVLAVGVTAAGAYVLLQRSNPKVAADATASVATVDDAPTQAAPADDVPASNFLPEIARVSVDTAYQAFLDGTAVFVDARSPSLYDEQHIPGALNIPYAEVETRLDELNPDDWIITYCI